LHLFCYVGDRRLVLAGSAQRTTGSLQQRVTAGAATVRAVLDDLSGSPLDRQLLARTRAVLADVAPAVDAYEQLLGCRAEEASPSVATRSGTGTGW